MKNLLVFLCTVLVMSFSVPAFAVSVDGMIGATEYDKNYSVTFGSGTDTHVGSLHISQDYITPVNSTPGYWGNVFMAVALPTTHVDNSYQHKDATANGGYVDNNGAKVHVLKDLIGSDKVKFKIGSQKDEVELKYEESTEDSYSGTTLWKEYGNGPNSNNSIENYVTSLQWNYTNANNNSTNFKLTGDKKEATSPVSTDSNYDEWIFDVIYEFEYSGLGDEEFLFSLTDPAATFDLLEVHASPSKTGPHTLPYPPIYVELPDPNVVPEPSTILLLGSGLAGLAFFRRKSKK